MTLHSKLISRSLGSSCCSVEALVIYHKLGGSNECTEYIHIDNLIKVNFRFKYEGQALQVLIKIEKTAEDCTVKSNISCDELKYSIEKICPEESCFEDMGKTMPVLNTWKEVLLYKLNITISAYKVEMKIYEKLCNDDEFADFRLSTGDGSVAVHKAYLAGHSDVFRAMLTREWKETVEGRISLEGVTLQTLQHLKNFMYLGTLPDDTDELLPMLSIASCYLIDNLKTECLMKLTKNIKPENFYCALVGSIENKMPELTFALIKATPRAIVVGAEQLSNEKTIQRAEEK